MGSRSPSVSHRPEEKITVAVCPESKTALVPPISKRCAGDWIEIDPALLFRILTGRSLAPDRISETEVFVTQYSLPGSREATPPEIITAPADSPGLTPCKVPEKVITVVLRRLEREMDWRQ
jgi:hypothetical protein